MAEGGDLITQSFRKGFVAVQALYIANKNDECIAACKDLLSERSIPYYFRIRTLCLLADLVEDWSEAYGHLEEAQKAFRWVQYCQTVGQDTLVDETMEKLSEMLDSCEDVLRAEAPTDQDDTEPRHQSDL